MRSKFVVLFLSAIFGILYIYEANAQANEDVIVDFSALESLSNDSGIVNVAQPLFPQIKAEPKIKKTANKKSAKIAKKKAKASKKIAKANIVVKPVAKQKPAVEVAQKATPVLPATPVMNGKEQWVEVVDVEPVSNSNTKPATKASPALIEKPKPAILPVENKKIIIDENKALKAAPAVNVVNSAITKAKDNVLPKKEIVAPKVISNKIKFTDNISELDADQKQQIEMLMNSFEDPSINKIAIYAYNLDNGKDTFKRKRLSLNRAVGIRSYLLKKGYKNFSIKVINIDDKSDAINMVEVQELK